MLLFQKRSFPFENWKDHKELKIAIIKLGKIFTQLLDMILFQKSSPFQNWKHHKELKIKVADDFEVQSSELSETFT